jgi:uncharacterized protein YybS (DUF2232 family)
MKFSLGLPGIPQEVVTEGAERIKKELKAMLESLEKKTVDDPGVSVIFKTAHPLW